MMCRAGQDSPAGAEDGRGSEGRGANRERQGSHAAAFAALLEDSADDLYENAPCGYLSTMLDGTIARINDTLLNWLGRRREELVGSRRFADLLTVGGKLYNETHLSPLLRMQGEVRGIALDLKAADGTRLPVLVASTVKTDADGEPLLIRTTVTDARDRRAYEQELLRSRREAEEARRRAEEAHRQSEEDRRRLQSVLATLQRSLLPPTLPAVPGLEAAAHYHTASPDHVGGDFYDLFDLGGGRWAFFLGDVCGKGPEAAAVTSLARYTLRAAAMHDPDPAAVLRTLNSVMYEQYTGDDPRYCTVISGLLVPRPDGEGGFDIAVASGGHPSALLLRDGGGAAYLPTPGGVLIGILPTPPITVTRTSLEPGDTLVLYTDGLTEARTEQDRYGDDGLLAFAEDLAPSGAVATVKALAALLDGFGDGLDDDTAILALGVPPAALPVPDDLPSARPDAPKPPC
ncbi:PP2C family protein-serine/threonine phosphatase [Streptomyces sp. SP18CS02]|uniref:PP2C family protein-serine/threonine phosphatase n=1 Tax=Streptomyces sp. SP18CS02 TaxID=3002531 RepID=UPI002E7630A5|nr:SpoIIE family protein phosphatase [Streptomyces sp. SP18CS02]MEE1757015.1 SpoIIE family protein phosphatase [Streptomyces sp. SP18CS02]